MAISIDISQIKSALDSGTGITREQALAVLSCEGIPLLSLLDLSAGIRFRHFGREVLIHILNNAENGRCPEDCRYCAQSASSSASIEVYALKSDEEILAEARAAHERGAFRYCMVFAGSEPSDERVEHLMGLVRTIKERWPLEVCVSPGRVTSEQARRLRAAGLDRLNHNLNTSSSYYSEICSSHTYEERVQTVRAAKAAGLAVCSGVIVGMGETKEDVFQMAKDLGALGADSIPVNFFIPLEGVALKDPGALTPEYCLRVLCLFRLMNPRTEIRMAAGRERHLRSLQPLGLYVANSLFLGGYLNAQGGADRETLAIVRDLGFSIRSEVPLEDLLKVEHPKVRIKDQKDLRPFCK
ncbi:MAG: biotin synthase BioB [Elusimicrobia bacterium]|nr:biotin synthase BioB [Elusimicrobiota bacterium]